MVFLFVLAKSLLKKSHYLLLVGVLRKGEIFMDVQKLRYFISVAKYLNFTDAAVEFGITQSAISQQLSELEKQIGTQLIIRNKRPVQLTWAGETLLKEAYSLITIFDQATKRIQLVASGKRGHLNIGFLGGMEKNILPRVIKSFRCNYPQVFTSLQQYTWTKINDALSIGEIDIGFTLSHKLDAYPDLIGERLNRGGLCVAVNRSHPRSSEKVINLTDLKKETFIMFSEEADPLLNELTLKLCAKHDFLPNVVNRSRDLSTLLAMVEIGVGIMLVPSFVRDNDKSNICFIELGNSNVCLDVIVAKNNKNQNPSIPIFVEQLSTYNNTSLFQNQSAEKLRLI